MDVVSLSPREVRDTGEYLGSLLSRQSVTVLPQVDGYVRRIHVSPGQQVEEGAPLIEVDAREETAARVRVVIEWRDGESVWGTVGVSENVVEASWQALADAVEYKLFKDEEAAK